MKSLDEEIVFLCLSFCDLKESAYLCCDMYKPDVKWKIKLKMW